MNNIQVYIKAENQNGILSIQGVDLFHIINTDWNWDNISLIQDSCIRTFFINAKKLLNSNTVKRSKEDDEIFNDTLKNSEEINSYYENLFSNSDTQREWILPEIEDNNLGDETEINYDIDDLDRTEIKLLIPYYKIIWHESVYRYIYDNLNLWACKIEEDIKVYKELCSIIGNTSAIISTIKIEKSPSKVVQSLTQKFNISKLTAETICNMKLYRLSALMLSDCKKTLQEKKELRSILTELITLKKRITEMYKANERIKDKEIDNKY